MHAASDGKYYHCSIPDAVLALWVIESVLSHSGVSSISSLPYLYHGVGRKEQILHRQRVKDKGREVDRPVDHEPGNQSQLILSLLSCSASMSDRLSDYLLVFDSHHFSHHYHALRTVLERIKSTVLLRKPAWQFSLERVRDVCLPCLV